jgi:hypothetical protein
VRCLAVLRQVLQSALCARVVVEAATVEYDGAEAAVAVAAADATAPVACSPSTPAVAAAPAMRRWQAALTRQLTPVR